MSTDSYCDERHGQISQPSTCDTYLRYRIQHTIHKTTQFYDEGCARLRDYLFYIICYFHKAKASWKKVSSEICSQSVSNNRYFPFCHYFSKLIYMGRV